MLDALRQTLVDAGMLTLTVRVHPGARSTQCKSVLDDGTVKIDIAAAPDDGKANEELIRYLSDVFEVRRQNIAILSGHVSRTKRVRIAMQ